MFSVHSLIPNYFQPNPESQVWGKDLSLEKGKSYRIIAPSGSGKSSLVLFLAGLSLEFGGEINFDSKPLKSSSKPERAALRANKISTVFQDLRLVDSLSLRENLLLKAQLGNVPWEEIQDFLRFFELDGMVDNKLGQLSQGEKQRAAIIRSLLQEFEFILLDEPFSHLNEEWHSKTWELIDTECKKRGAGKILTSLDGAENWTFDLDLRL